MLASLIRTPSSFLLPGESVHAQREHADGEPGAAGQHGLSVVSLHRLHDGRRGWQSGGKAQASICDQVAEDGVRRALRRHGHVFAAQTRRVCQGKAADLPHFSHNEARA